MKLYSRSIPALMIAVLAGAALLAPAYSNAQEGPLSTQALVTVERKGEPVTITAKDLMVSANGSKEKQPVSALTPLQPSGVQIALLIDDGLRESLGNQIKDIKTFVQSLDPGTEVMLGYMRNGTVEIEQPFTTDHAAVASKVRLPIGAPGISASPYFCLSDFVKHWPSAGVTAASSSTRGDLAPQAVRTAAKARMVMMLTNGVDPYNGSTSILNQDSPYVQSAGEDAERAGVAVYSIYFPNSGLGNRGGRASFSGQSYLEQVAEATGGQSYYNGSIPPVALLPYFKHFQRSIQETYIATFPAVSRHDDRDLVQIKMSTELEKVKLHHPDSIRPGNVETSN